MDKVVTIKDARGIRWQVSATFAPLFLADRAPDPRRLLKRGPAQLIKKSPARVIFSSSLSNGREELPVVIKVYRHPEPRDWLKSHILGSKARHEWRMTVAAAEKGLRTVVPVAYGERRRLGLLRESYLLTVRLFGCVTLEEALFYAHGAQQADARGRRRMVVALAALLRRMHDSGIYHRDLHPGNFLVETPPSGEKRLYLLDLHRASARPALSLYQRVESLAQFNMFASISLRNSERLLFFDAYFGGDAPWKNEKRALLDLIDSRTRKMRWKLWRGRERRCMGGNKYFIRLRFARLRGFARRGEWKGEMAELLLSDDMARDGARLVKESGSKELWAKEFALNGATRTLFIKHYKRKQGAKALTYLFRRSQALRSWRGAYAIDIRNIRGIRSIAALEERGWFHRLGDAYLISEGIGGVVNLRELLAAAAAAPGVGTRAVRQASRALAFFLRRVHRRGIYHGDLKATNILVGRTHAGNPLFYLTDTDYVRTRFRLSRRQVVRNLAQINKSLLDLGLVAVRQRLRFLKDYCGPAGRAEVRRLWGAVSRRTARSLRKSGRHFHHEAHEGRG